MAKCFLLYILSLIQRRLLPFTIRNNTKITPKGIGMITSVIPTLGQDKYTKRFLYHTGGLPSENQMTF